MSFARPLTLILLVLVPITAALLWLAIFRRKQSAVRFAAADMLADLVPNAGWRQWLPPALLLLAIAVGAVAAAGPQRTALVARDEATLVLALDTSISMEATDVAPNRIDAAKSAAVELLEALPADVSAGIVSFAGNATIVETPSSDRAAAISAVRRLQTARGTALGTAIEASLDALALSRPSQISPGRGDEPTEAIILLSDGESQLGIPPFIAAGDAADQNVPVYTIAFGTGNATVDVDGTPVPVSVDDAELRQIAEISGGEFFRAFDENALEQVFNDIGTRVGLEEEQIDLTGWFVIGAVIVLVGALTTSVVWYGRLI